MSPCKFCAILEGTVPASFVYRDRDVAAFMDIHPINPGHLLVVPTNHGSYLADISDAVAGRLMEVGHRLAAAIRCSGLQSDGINFFLADGEAALQDVFHVHLHVIPRVVGDGFGLTLPPGYGDTPPRADLDEAASLIRTGLAEVSP